MVAKLRPETVLVCHGQSVADVIRAIGVTDETNFSVKDALVTIRAVNAVVRRRSFLWGGRKSGHGPE